MSSTQHTYAALRLVYTFWMCGELRSDGAHRKASIWALRLTLPPDQADKYIQKLCSEKHQIPLPSAVTISRARGQMDTAWMFVFREKLADMMKGGSCLYLMWMLRRKAAQTIECLLSTSWNYACYRRSSAASQYLSIGAL